MAGLDVARTALVLTEEELAVAALLGAEPEHPSLAEPPAPEMIERLERAGIASGGRVSGYPARLLAVVAAPKLRVTVERFAAAETLVDRAWATERFGVWGEVTRERALELTPVEPGLLPWAISRAVGLGPRARPKLERPIALASSALDEAFERYAAGDREAAEATLEKSGLAPDERAAFLDLLRDRRLSWRASSIWTDSELGERLGSVAVIDAGSSGLWLVDHSDDPLDPMLSVTPIRPSQAWRRIVELMPAPAAGPRSAEATGV